MTIQDDAAELLEGRSVLELVAQGKNIRAAAEELGISKSVAHRRYQRELQAALEDNRELAGMLVHQELETLRQLQEVWMPRATQTDYGDTDEENPKGWGKDQEGAAKIVLAVVDKRSKLLGLDAAIKHEVSVDRINDAVDKVAALLASENAAPLTRVTSVPEEG
jgi:hypothetical protein